MNEYLNLIRPALIPDDDNPGEQVVDWLTQHTGEARATDRYKLCRRYSWAIPTEPALAELTAHAPLVEIGAGTGYWAMLLRERGVDITAYDLHPPVIGAEDNHWHQNVPTWTVVLPGNAAYAARHPDRALFLCWPPMSPMAHEALCSYRGNCVIYIGEGFGNCTADDAFHNKLEREWKLVKTVKVLRWWGCHDRMMIYERSTHHE